MCVIQFRFGTWRIFCTNAGAVRAKLVEAGRANPLASGDDKTQPISLLQDEPADHPPGGNDVHTVPVVATERGGSAA